MKKEGNIIIFEYLSQTDDSKLFYEKENIAIKIDKSDKNIIKDLNKFVKMGEYYGKLLKNFK